MRINNPATHILNSQAKIACLRLLCTHPTELNGTQLGKIVGLTPATVHKAMKELFNEQIVTLKGAGNSHLYELNKENIIVQEMLIPLFLKEAGLLNGLIDEIRKIVNRSSLKNQILSLALFGSVHEKRERATSDVDLFVLIRDKKIKDKVMEIFIDRKSIKINAMGLTLEPYVKTLEELKKDKKLETVRSILKSNTLILGESPEVFL